MPVEDISRHADHDTEGVDDGGNLRYCRECEVKYDPTYDDSKAIDPTEFTDLELYERYQQAKADSDLDYAHILRQDKGLIRLRREIARRWEEVYEGVQPLAEFERVELETVEDE